MASASSVGLKTYSYPHILNQLSSNEVKILDILYGFFVQEAIATKIEWVKRELICDNMMLKDEEVIVYLGNLFRLGLCRGNTIAVLISGNSPEYDVLYDKCTLTHLGADFVRACRGPADND